jgi:D-3-phosphoglycerate dehydrogenase
MLSARFCVAMFLSSICFHCNQFGCLVVNAPTANTVAAAEHGIALLCALARNIPAADAAMKAGKWDGSAHVGTSLGGKTLAIIGFGKVRWSSQES